MAAEDCWEESVSFGHVAPIDRPCSSDGPHPHVHTHSTTWTPWVQEDMRLGKGCGEKCGKSWGGGGDYPNPLHTHMKLSQNKFKIFIKNNTCFIE